MEGLSSQILRSNNAKLFVVRKCFTCDLRITDMPSRSALNYGDRIGDRSPAGSYRGLLAELFGFFSAHLLFKTQNQGEDRERPSTAGLGGSGL